MTAEVGDAAGGPLGPESEAGGVPVDAAPAGPVAVAVGVSRAYRAWLGGVGLVVVFILVLLWGANRPAKPTFADTQSRATATTPSGPQSAEKKVGVGTQCLRMLVADTPQRRAQGLGGRSSPSPYDGMVFEFGQTMSQGTRFTMSDVKFAITIGFYDQTGIRVDALDMEPCSGNHSTCPTYSSSKAPFNTALEVAKGQLPDGPLRPCP